MDYTTLQRVKDALKITIDTEDTQLAQLVTEASRAVDRFCTGVGTYESDNYFALETKTDEILNGIVNKDGEIICYAHKPIVQSIAEFHYRKNAIEPEKSVDPSRIDISSVKIKAYPQNLGFFNFPCKCRIRMTYTGGFSGSPSGLPEDFTEVVSLLASRFYREEESGITDVIGVAELGSLVYTKAFPVRVQEQLQPYKRQVGWNYVA